MNTSALGSVYGKKLGRNLHLRVRLEQLARERRERALQIGHRDALADDQPFDLLKHRRVRQVEIVAAVDLAGHDDAHRRLVALHVADLHRRGVRAQQRRRTADGPATSPDEIERVLHVARRMLGRHVERFEVVVVVFDFGAFEHLIAQAREDRFDLLADDGQRMAMADLRRRGRAARCRPRRPALSPRRARLCARRAAARSPA